MEGASTFLLLLLLLVCSHAATEDPSIFVRCETSAGGLTIELRRHWAPHGVRRFLELVKDNFFNKQLIYRVLPGFVAQFGIAADPEQHKKWKARPIPDDPPSSPATGGLAFDRGVVSFAGHGENSRTSHIFIADEPRGRLLGHRPFEVPIGRILERGEIDPFFKNVHSGYGDLTSLQHDLEEKGNEAARDYPDLTVIERCYVVKHSEAAQYVRVAAEKREAEQRAKEQAIKDEEAAQKEVARRREETIDSIRRLLEDRAPKRVRKLPQLLKQWVGKEEELLNELRSQLRPPEEL